MPTYFVVLYDCNLPIQSAYLLKACEYNCCVPAVALQDRDSGDISEGDASQRGKPEQGTQSTSDYGRGSSTYLCVFHHIPFQQTMIG